MTDNSTKLISDAISAFNQGDYTNSLNLAKALLVADEFNLDAVRLVGMCSYRLGLMVEAEHFCKLALDINSKDVSIAILLADLLTGQERYSEAEQFYNQAINGQTESTLSYLKKGIMFRKAGRLQDAANCYAATLAIDPGNADGHYLMANVCASANHFDAAEKHYSLAIRFNPKSPDVYLNFGLMLMMIGKKDQAEDLYRTALKTLPDVPRIHFNLGCLLYGAKKFDDAEFHYRRAIALKPDYADAVFNLSFILLQSGRFKEGWRLYEARCDQKMSWLVWGRPDVGCPQWNGESLIGKSLVIWQEQGFGDVIQFARFATTLKKEWGVNKITFVCDAPLQALLGTLKDIDVLALPEESEAFRNNDYWTFPLSIPLWIGTTLESIPSSKAYLFPLQKRMSEWKPRLPRLGMRVGLVWKASRNHRSTVEKSLPSLSVLAKLWQIPDVSFISLQKEDGEDQAINSPPNQPILHLGSDIRDFADVAAISAQLDLVITIDTAMAHVGGAIGVPTWIMLPFVANWRWMQDRLDCPWYPGVRLFRQKQAGMWDGVVDQVVLALRELKR